MQYKAYGHVKRTLIEKVDTNLRFQGQYYDGETGLHYNRHRYYHPGSGHYLTPDPIKLAGGLNHYQYVPNPVNWVDPLGLACTGCDVPGQRKKQKSRDNREFNSREEAEAAIYQKAGIDIDTPPDAIWEVGNDINKRGQTGYFYSNDVGAIGIYKQYETSEGFRVIVEHTGEEYPHFHYGVPKGDSSRDSVDFGWGGENSKDLERYSNPDNHHYYSRLVLDLNLREIRGLPPLRNK
ncbi:RHS repeat-associated core domain-containing protein [Pokkaliibacter sp. MBI-7]|uniref:RHS repeat-associated core domain-containing protein n=1 Tax=Pokkaliibacter sp. MBI-7 TaxID=3040600 RepID=UPI002448DEFA|nr:RHS repeat-associated core domain-containing protein [Pokkaliibacter sp. MBI-7]MDH2434014.1 RHS repeat-associated core domain-containing protein [Pokkaliibacter sp. MBI-7]